MRSQRGLLRRLMGPVLLYAVAYVSAVLLRWEPQPVLLALVVGLVVLLFELVLGLFRIPTPLWTLESTGPVTPPGRDAGYATYLRHIEGQLTAATPDAAFRDRLGMLVDRRLMQHHGLRRDDPRARELIGPELADLLGAPPRRVGLAEIDRHLTRIEEL